MNTTPITEKVHTERKGNTRITILKYTEPDYPTTYTAYLEHDSSDMAADIGNYATEYETYSYDTRKEALTNARAEATDLNKHLDKYWI